MATPLVNGTEQYLVLTMRPCVKPEDDSDPAEREREATAGIN